MAVRNTRGTRGSVLISLSIVWGSKRLLRVWWGVVTLGVVAR